MTTECERNRNILIVLKCHACGAVSGSSALTKAHFRKLHEKCKFRGRGKYAIEAAQI